jgi:hypothetical protein
MKRDRQREGGRGGRDRGTKKERERKKERGEKERV